MIDFVKLEEENDSLNLNVISKIKPEVEIENDSLIQIDNIKKDIVDLPKIFIGSCDVSRFYGDTNENDSFKKSNLFSELVDEFQRSVARKNLGISDKYSLTWGSINGNILQQTDLFNLIKDSSSEINSNLRIELTQLLSDMQLSLTDMLESRASLDSPKFTGTPKSTTPFRDDNSDRIATTEWVNSKLLTSTGDNNLSYIYFDKTFMYVDESNVSVKLIWDYNKTITSQFINGIEIGTNIREYTFSNINDSFNVTLTFVIDGKSYNKSLNFEKITPYYYGETLNIEECTKTENNNFNVEYNGFIYIYVPNGINARIGVDNIIGGFKFIKTMFVSDIIYYVYRSVNNNLGKTHIKIW